MKKIIIVFLCLTMLLPGVCIYANVEETEQDEAYEVFTDVDKDAWYHKYVDMMYKTGRMEGTSENTFEPERTLTREEAIAVLVKSVWLINRSFDELYEQKPDLKPIQNVFDDVNESEWYYPYIDLAYKLGYTKGIGNNKFGIGKPITREDFATMIYSTIDFSETDVNGKQLVTYFNDYSDISHYAIEVFELFCNNIEIHHKEVSEGAYHSINPVFVGYNNYLFPKKPITRAETAVVIFRVFLEASWHRK